MSTPTVPVTVDLGSMGGSESAVSGIVVRAILDGNEVYDEIIIAKMQAAVTDENGVAVFNLFPNAPPPTGLGTQGTTYRFVAAIPGGRGLNVNARVPNEPCRLENILVSDEDPPALDAAELAVLQAQAAVTNAASSASAAAASATAAEEDRAAVAADKEAIEDFASEFGDLTTAIESTQQSAAAAAADASATALDRVQTGLDATAAEAAKEDAETARDQSYAAGRVYEDAATGDGDAGLSNGDYFYVISADDAEVYELWQKDGSGGTDTGKRIPSTAALERVTDLVDSEEAEPLLRIEDADNNIVAEMAADGGLVLPNMGGEAVQDALSRHEAVSGLTGAGEPTDILNVADDDGNLTLRQDKYGGLYVPGIPGTVQAALGYGYERITYPTRTSRDEMTSAIKAYVLDHIVEGRDFVRPPPLLVPNNYTVPDGIVDAFTVSYPAEPTSLQTPYEEDGESVHNYTIEMPRPWRGYRYIMAMTPYRTSLQENPVLYGSNDLENFVMLPSMEQPLGVPQEAVDAGTSVRVNTDNGITYDPRSGELIVFWRYAVGAGDASEYFYARRTVDGYHWTERETIFTSVGTGNFLSPAILFNPADSLWHMWMARQENLLTHYTASELTGPWTQQSEVNTSITYGFIAWHLEVKFMGSKYVLLVNQKSSPANLLLGISSDGDTWTIGDPIISPSVDGTYKGSFIPEFDGDLLRLVLLWNTNDTGDLATSQRFFVARTNQVDLTTL